MNRIIVVFVGAVLAGMCSCGGAGTVTLSGGASVPNATQGLTAGNWFLTAVSQVPNQSGSIDYANLRGTLAASGNAVAGMLTPDAGCLVTFSALATYNAVSFSGPISGSSLTLTSANVNGTVATITGTITDGSNINGSYTSAGGPNSQFASNSLCNGNQGTVYGTLVPAITGNWSGNLANYAPDPIHGGLSPTYCGGSLDPTTCVPTAVADTITFTAAFVQATTANPDGSTPLNGTVTLQADAASGNALACYTSSGTVDSTNSYILGDSINIIIDANGATLQLSGSLANPGTATQMGTKLGSGTLGLLSLSSSACTSSQFVAYGILSKS